MGKYHKAGMVTPDTVTVYHFFWLKSGICDGRSKSVISVNLVAGKKLENLSKVRSYTNFERSSQISFFGEKVCYSNYARAK